MQGEKSPNLIIPIDRETNQSSSDKCTVASANPSRFNTYDHHACAGNALLDERNGDRIMPEEPMSKSTSNAYRTRFTLLFLDYGN
uniref:Uncharacterized protein n=1 Tax=Rhizophora mucronata TaxID=61149 RepID=A0A2P2NNX4_RHIMU